MIKRSKTGKIKIAATSKSGFFIKLLLLILVGLTVFSFFSFDYKGLNVVQALTESFYNVGVVFGQPRLEYSTFGEIIHQLLITVALGFLATLFGALIGFFGALLCAENIATPKVGFVLKSVVALVRAVPTILWVLIFAIASGLGSVAAISGMTFHSAAFLIKSYTESIEEMDKGAIEALKASGAGFWQIVFQVVLPSSIRPMIAWTFMRLEINFISALAVGAASGAGGIGHNLYMAGSYYLNLRELGFITYTIVITVIILEITATKIKAKVR